MKLFALSRMARAFMLPTALLLAFLSGSASGQSNVDGSVTGSAAPGTTLMLNSTETGFSRTVTTSAGGGYKFVSVPPGKYRLSYKDQSGKTLTQEITVTLGEAANVDFVAGDATQLDTVVVTGSNVAPVDLTQTESVLVISSERIESMPVVRDVQAVALLAPGTTEGDSRFLSQSGRPLIAFGGASPGENTFYLNGLNITDFRNFLGGANVPFQFFREFQVRTGGYSAEFGRSLGGVVNAVTKRGSNDWSVGANLFYEPDELRTDSPDVTVNGVYRIDNRSDARDDFQTNIEVGGPLLANRLYGYGFVSLRQVDTEGAAGTSRFAETSSSDPFFGLKLDLEVFQGHSLEYTGFSNEDETETAVYVYNTNGPQVLDRKSNGLQKEGGQTHILRYLGSLTDTVSLSVLFGRHERESAAASRSAVTGAPCAVIVDRRGTLNSPLGCWDASGNGQVESTEDTRDAFRTDLSWFLGAHTVKLGVDYEKNISDTQVGFEGGVAYRYITDAASSTGESVRVRYYDVSGEFKEELTAFYIEDAWQVTDRFLLSLGIRNETLENFNKNGNEFLDFDRQLTPRLGAAYDLTGGGRHKLFANLGRYTMPIATNTNIRFAGGEFFTEQFFELEGTNPDDTPIIGAPRGPLTTYSDGSVPDPSASVDANIDPMYQDEMMFGFESAVTDKTVIGSKFIYRKLVRAVEDSSFTDANNNFSYFLFNPGEDVTLNVDTDGDGVGDTPTTYSSEDLGYPSASRKYYAVELTADHSFSRDLQLGGSYTWSHSYGNFEGVFQSDVGQDDAGITIAFDEIGLADHSYGNLPNDRRHKLKLYGTFIPVADWTLGANFSAFSGRPKNKLGNCPPSRPGYPEDCFYEGIDTDGDNVDDSFEARPRGSFGETSWVLNLDLGLRYNPSMLKNRFTVGMDIFNVLNGDSETRINEVNENSAGTSQAAYGSPAAFQQPRRVRLSLEYNFF